jgi:hypothetical protein
MPVSEEINIERQFATLAKTTRGPRGLTSGAALWESVAGEWVLLECGCVAGYEAGPPPAEPGTYEGQIIRKLCEPVSG